MFNALGYEQVTGMTSAKTLTPPSGATHALIQTESQNVRWRDDGTSPTASVGVQLEAGKDFWYTGKLSVLEFIQEAATAKLNVSYYN